MKIPKLANGGIVKDNSLFVSKEKGKDLFYDKYYAIYKRTKNRRIKKKQLKKSWILKFQNSIKQNNIELTRLLPEKINVILGGEIIKKIKIDKQYKS